MTAGTGVEDAAAPPDLRLAATALGCWGTAVAGLVVPAPVSWSVAGAAGLVAAAGALLAHRRPGTALGWVLAAFLLGAVCGASATAARVGERDAQPLHALASSHTSVHVGLVVTDDPRLAGRGGTAVVPARLTWLEAPDRPRIGLGARVLVLASDTAWRRLLPGQEVIASGRLAPPRGGDLRAAVLSAAGAPDDAGTVPVAQRAAGDLRAGLQRACASLPAEPGGLLPGLVVGDVSRLDPALADDFRTTGLTHLTAVSGSNCAIITGAVLLLARRCRAGPRLSAVLCAAALVGFVILVRPSPSVLRAAAMGGLALAALAMGRPRAAVPALSAAVLVLVVVDPELAADAGFALSVLATAGLLLLAPRWTDRLREHGVPAGVADALAVPAAAQVACAPVIAAISATVSLSAVPANLLAVPAVAPATVFGVAAAVVSPFWAGGAEFAAWIASWPARWLVAIAHRGADVPAGLLPWPGGWFGALLLAGLLLALLFAARRPVVRRLVLVTAVAAMLGALPVRLAASGWPPPGWFAVACDVGQGDAIVLAAGPGSAVVVDSGPEPGAVDRCLRRLDITAVPLLVISHFHLDHVGGVEGVLRGRTVDRVLVAGYPEPAAGHTAVLAAAGAHAVPVDLAPAGTTYAVGPLRLTVIGPVHELGGTRSDPNNNSIMLSAVNGRHSMLLAGDAEGEEQRTLLATGDLHAEVLKLAHHGSAYQDLDFLAAVDPAAALVSVGVNNDYGHPNAAVLARLARDGVRVARTDRDGDVAVTDDEGRLAVVVRGVDPGRRPR